jgi:hypothetical protein
VIRITLRQNRSEIAGAAALSALGATSVLAIALATRSTAEALAHCEPAATCGDQAATLGQLLTWIPGTYVASIGAAAFFGAALGGLAIAAELEGGTALLAWSLAPNRRRWLLDRAGILAGALLIMLAPWALAIWFVASSMPAGNGPTAMDLYGGSGQMLGIALIAFAIATLLGLELGRAIPTVVGASVATWFIAAILGWGFGVWRLAGALDVSTSGGLVLAAQAVGLDGTIVTLAEAVEEADRLGRPFAELYRVVELGVPIAGLGAIVIREALTYLAVAAALIGMTFSRITARRPLLG